MKQLVFSAQRKIIIFIVDGRKVTYFDDNWKAETDEEGKIIGGGVQIYPLDRLLVKKMTLSRKPSVSAMGLLIVEANQGKNLEEYESCRTEEDIAEMIRKDTLSKGLVEVVKE